MRSSAKDLQKAKSVVFRLLKIRLRSEQEIRDKLENKEFPTDVIRDTIAYLKEYGFIDDRQFTQIWITSRLKRPFGVNRIRYELVQKGIDKDLLDEELLKAAQNKDYAEIDIIKDLAQRRARQYKNIDHIKKRQRLFGFLSRRGFSSSAITKALKEL